MGSGPWAERRLTSGTVTNPHSSATREDLDTGERASELWRIPMTRTAAAGFEVAVWPNAFWGDPCITDWAARTQLSRFRIPFTSGAGAWLRKRNGLRAVGVVAAERFHHEERAASRSRLQGLIILYAHGQTLTDKQNRVGGSERVPHGLHTRIPEYGRGCPQA